MDAEQILNNLDRLTDNPAPYSTSDIYLGLEQRLAVPRLFWESDFTPLAGLAAEVVDLLSTPALGSFTAGISHWYIWETLKPCLRRDLPRLCGRAVRTCRYLSGVADDVYLTCEINSALAGLRSTKSEHEE